MGKSRAIGPVARVMRDEMDRRKLTFEELAEQTGFPRSTLHTWACGLRVPRVTDAAKLATALGVDLPTLAGTTTAIAS